MVKNKQKVYFSISVMLLLIIACQVRYRQLQNTRQPYVGSEMRIDGYYFRSETNARDIDNIYYAVMFYRNGVFDDINFLIHPYSFDSLERKIDELAGKKFRIKMGKGVFKIDGDELLVEYWANASSSPVPTGIKKGKILNDTTISIGLFSSNDGDIWHFKHYPVKLDSIYEFID